ncbi:MAG: hypothetical protein JWN67_4991 [Actinomycetia bacterium]|nr:hypothetical protein [Actinomycetes bacterium]
MTPSTISVFITDEILTLVAQDVDELGAADLPLPDWSVALGGSFGSVTRALSMAVQTDATQDLRTAAVRLAADLVAMVEQLDQDSGRAAEILGGVEVPVVPLEAEGDYASPREVEPVRAEDEPFDDTVVRHVDFTGGGQVTAVPSDPDVTYWNADRWRTHLRAVGVRVSDAIRAAQALARTLDENEPGTLDEIRSPALFVGLRGWVEQQAVTA